MREWEAHLSISEDALRAAHLTLAAGLLRDAMSRSYYAVYHAAHALLASVGEEARTHKGVLHRTRERFGDQLGTVGLQTLNRLQQLREGSDYEVSFELTHEEADRAWHAARTFVDAARRILERLDPSPTNAE